MQAKVTPMNDDERKKLPQWAKDRIEADEAMGELETSASPGLMVVGTLYIAFRIGLFVGICVLMYLIGKAVVG